MRRRGHFARRAGHGSSWRLSSQSSLGKDMEPEALTQPNTSKEIADYSFEFQIS